MTAGAKVTPLRPDAPLDQAQAAGVKFAYAELDRLERELRACLLILVGIDETLLKMRAPVESPLLPGNFGVNLLPVLDQVATAQAEIRRRHADVLFPGARAPAFIDSVRAQVRAELDGERAPA